MFLSRPTLQSKISENTTYRDYKDSLKNYLEQGLNLGKSFHQIFGELLNSQKQNSMFESAFTDLIKECFVKNYTTFTPEKFQSQMELATPPNFSPVSPYNPLEFQSRAPQSPRFQGYSPNPQLPSLSNISFSGNF